MGESLTELQNTEREACALTLGGFSLSCLAELLSCNKGSGLVPCYFQKRLAPLSSLSCADAATTENRNCLTTDKKTSEVHAPEGQCKPTPLPLVPPVVNTYCCSAFFGGSVEAGWVPRG